MADSNEYYRHSRPDVAPLLPDEYSTVLEVGCAEGTFRAHVRNDCEYWGIEPVAAAAAVAGTRMDKVLVGTFDSVECQIPDDYFDLVVCNDVIEHMACHDTFIQAVRAKMKETGRLVASVPNVRYVDNLINLLVRRDWKYEKSGILDQTHMRFFTAKSLRRVFEENGFEVELLKGLNSCMKYGRLKRWMSLPFVICFGSDTQYHQFGVRVHKTDSREVG